LLLIAALGHVWIYKIPRILDEDSVFQMDFKIPEDWLICLQVLTIIAIQRAQSYGLGKRGQDIFFSNPTGYDISWLQYYFLDKI